MNVDLARKVVAHLEAHPEQHNQGHFVDTGYNCGTTACIAGWTMLLSGKYELDTDGYDFVPINGGVEGGDADRAQDLLGIDFSDREHLFFTLQDNQEALDYLRELIING